ncbi:MAG: chromosome segregation protein SMC [Deltaproteobacteria bacterium]|nr:chromosome segregation protein SMC [Deltaproteobacteria bacterium]
MKLAKLDILGFKSFRDKTPLEFSEGISAIVGPNGCGKSNIVDAIRWVMGEQRFTALRGKKMEDVIFNGSDGTAGVNIAEVTMTLERNGRIFPGKFAEMSEITISRRLYRDGESEYFINKAPCRLLDVREFFMDMGVGARTYSIVEQERVTKLVEAKPQDRREFIEEAAGIVKYKSRRESATRKIEATQQNITRLNDILREVKSQLNATARQAKKAERYKELRKEIKEARLQLSLQTYAELTARRAQLQHAADSLNKEHIEAQTALKSSEAAVEDMRSQLAEQEAAITDLQERFYSVRNEINIKEQGINFARETIRELQRKKEANIREIAGQEQRRKEINQEIDGIHTSTEEYRKRINDLTSLMVEIQKTVEGLRVRERSLHETLEMEKSSHIDRVAEQARVKNVLAALLKGMDSIGVKITTEEKELAEKKKQRTALEKKRTALAAQLSADREGLAKLISEEENIQAGSQQKEAELATLLEEIDGIRQEIGIASSRLTSLKELRERFELCSEGTRTILKAVQTRELPRDEVLGLVADNISVPRNYETAVEAALEDKLQYVIVKSQKEGMKAIDYLKQRASGRGSFIPLELRNGGTDETLPAYLKGAVRLADHVTPHDDHYRPIVDYLLKDVLLISDLRTALGLWEKNGFTGTYVTPEGDIIRSDGVITGGSAVNGEGSLLRNNREIEELNALVDALNGRLAKSRSHAEKLKTALSALRERTAVLRTQIHEQQIAINGREKDLERLDGEASWIDQAITVATFNRDTLESEKEDALRRIEELRQEEASQKEAMASAGERITALQEEWTRLKEELAGRDAELVEKRISITSLEEQHKGKEETLARLDKALLEAGEAISQLHVDLRNGENKAAETAQSIERDETALTGLYETYNGLEKDLSHRRELQGNRESVLREHEVSVLKERRLHEELAKKAGNLEIEIRELNIKLETLARAIEEKYAVDIEELLPGFAGLSESETEQLHRKLTDSEKKIEEFGEVNLLALSEHEQLRERHDFLAIQLKDLNESIESLQRTISRINQISRKRFAETFEAVDGYFQEVFPRLFPGGKGRLILTDEEDMLETGVDIELQIPGKRRQNLSLLSGGEKALSAVALIFSILLYRPTPFLVLDEADAPLDDTNVYLFKNLVKDVARNSQVIYITHNKQTMEAADNLIGVTMAKNGISSIVSVSLN